MSTVDESRVVSWIVKGALATAGLLVVGKLTKLVPLPWWVVLAPIWGVLLLAALALGVVYLAVLGSGD